MRGAAEAELRTVLSEGRRTILEARHRRPAAPPPRHPHSRPATATPTPAFALSH